MAFLYVFVLVLQLATCSTTTFLYDNDRVQTFLIPSSVTTVDLRCTGARLEDSATTTKTGSLLRARLPVSGGEIRIIIGRDGDGTDGGGSSAIFYGQIGAPDASFSLIAICAAGGKNAASRLPAVGPPSEDGTGEGYDLSLFATSGLLLSLPCILVRVIDFLLKFKGKSDTREIVLLELDLRVVEKDLHHLRAKEDRQQLEEAIPL